jgi:pyruvate/2-oxoglutarate dehydrogenase complex dihydrolipoamide dehydrogenase (E3) component
LAAREGEAFGLHIPQVRTDLSAIIARKRSLIGDFADYRKHQLETGVFDFFRGHASFLDSKKISVELLGGGTIEISSSYFLIATGSKNSHPEIPGLAEAGCLTSDDVLEAEELPHSVIVLGAGPVALEMAHYMHAMGVKVTIVQRSPQFLRGVDPDLADVVESAFRERGMEIHTGTKLLRVEGSADGVRVHFEKEGEIQEVGAAAIFNGLGRQPNLAGLKPASPTSLQPAIVAARLKLSTLPSNKANLPQGTLPGSHTTRQPAKSWITG